MAKTINPITKESIKSMIKNCDICTPGDSAAAESVTINELANVSAPSYEDLKRLSEEQMEKLSQACKEAAPLYMEPLKEYLLKEEE